MEEESFIPFKKTNSAALPTRNSAGVMPVRSSIGKHNNKSTTKLEEKFKKYVSDVDMLFRTLSKASDSYPLDEDMCDSQHLFNRNTESFKCLAQLMLSNSSLMKNRLFLFPPLEDPGITIAFNFQEPPPENDDVGAEKYKKLCKEMEIVPISRIISSLETDTLDLKYYGLTNKQIKALTEAMKANARVQNLILQDNWLTVEMTQMVSDMIVENTSLQYLSLRECRIGEEGAQKLGEVLSSLQSLKSLDLSFNDLGDRGLLALRDGLCNNISLKKLNISHNNITEDSGETMEKVLVENKHLEDLDLSWSGFYTAQGNRRLFSGFMNSDRIKILNLAWNGIGIPAAVRPLTRYLRNSENLEEVNLSNNRLEGQSLRTIRGAINKNHSLRIVKIGNNIYSPEDAHFMLTVLAGKPKDPLHHLDMENMYLQKESKPILNKIKNLDRTVKIGGILSDYEIQGPNPKKLIYERCRYILTKPKKAKARKDFGHFILSLPEAPVSPEDFQKELKKQKIKKLDKDLVQGVMNLFMNKRKLIECTDLVKDYMSFYPETRLPPPKPKKGKKGKKGKKEKKGKQKDTEEKEVKVHDLENAASKTEIHPTDDGHLSKDSQTDVNVNRKSRLSIKVVTSRKSIGTKSDSKVDIVQKGKSVTILPKPSVMLSGQETSAEVPEADVVPKKSIIKIRGNKAEVENSPSKNDLAIRRSSTRRSRGSVKPEGEVENSPSKNDLATKKSRSSIKMEGEVENSPSKNDLGIKRSSSKSRGSIKMEGEVENSPSKNDLGIKRSSSRSRGSIKMDGEVANSPSKNDLATKRSSTRSRGSR